MMKKNTVDFWVGLFALLGLFSLLFLALKAGNMSSSSLFESNYTIESNFDNIGGLKIRAPVKCGGVVIGRVSQITLNPESYQAVVTLSINKKYAFPTDSSAKILTSGLLGEQYIGLEPGGDDHMLGTGDTLKFTQSAMVLENLIGQFLYNKAADMGKNNNTAPTEREKANPTQ